MSENSKISTLTALNETQQQQMLALHMPVGRFWENCFDETTNLGKLIKSLAREYYRLGVLTEEIANDFNIDNTVDFLKDWEDSVGIPSDLFKRTSSIENRRKHVKYIFTNFWGVQTAEDFVRVASFFDYNVIVKPATETSTWSMLFPIFFFSAKSVKYTIIVYINNIINTTSYFPLYFQYYFNDGGVNFLKNLFELLAPANCNVLFSQNINIQ